MTVYRSAVPNLGDPGGHRSTTVYRPAVPAVGNPGGHRSTTVYRPAVPAVGNPGGLGGKVATRRVGSSFNLPFSIKISRMITGLTHAFGMVLSIWVAICISHFLGLGFLDFQFQISVSGFHVNNPGSLPISLAISPARLIMRFLFFCIQLHAYPRRR